MAGAAMTVLWLRIQWWRFLAAAFGSVAAATWWLHERWHPEDAPYSCDMCDERAFLVAVSR
jgi:hypothetical protein